jgi:transcriptional regulator with XRE-family HTH domain
VNIYKIVGNNIRGFRSNKGWTQEKLGIRAKMNVNYLSCIERAEKKVTLETLVKIAKTLKIPLNLLFIENSFESKELLVKKNF